MSITIGKKAPTFDAVNQDGEKVSLKDLLGRWTVLYFYPRDNTSGCTTEACEFSEGIRQFEGLDARVIGVSPDSPESHRKFIAKYKLNFDLLSDPEHEVMEKFGAWGQKVMYGKKVEGVIRSTVLIEPAGKVAFHWAKVKAAGHAAEVAAKLREVRG